MLSDLKNASRATYKYDPPMEGLRNWIQVLLDLVMIQYCRAVKLAELAHLGSAHLTFFSFLLFKLLKIIFWIKKINFDLKKDKNSYFLLKKNENVLNLITKSCFYILNWSSFPKKTKQNKMTRAGPFRLNGLGWKWVSLNGHYFLSLTHLFLTGKQVGLTGFVHFDDPTIFIYVFYIVI